MAVDLTLKMEKCFRGDKLRACRAYWNDTLEDFADDLGISCEELKALESGNGSSQISLDIDFLEALREISGMSWEIFFTKEPLILS